MATTFRVLGPLEVLHDGEPVALGTGRQRALLAILLLHANEVLSTARLSELLWDEPPPTAAKIVQNCVVGLRRSLPAETLLTRPRGYELRVDRDALDAEAFARGVEQGRAQLAAGDAAGALALFDGALALWRGAPLAEVGDAPATAAYASRLEELRLDAALGRADALLALGRHDEAVPDLRQSLADDPLDERVAAALMLALYRAGRQGDALAVYRRTRRALIEALGVEPGPPLRRLEQRILRQEPGLEPPPPDAPRRARRAPRRPRAVVAVVVAAAAAAVVAAVLPVLVGRPGARPVAKPPDAVAVVDEATGRYEKEIPVGSAPVAAAVAGHEVWVANQGDGTVMAIDARRAQIDPPTLAVSANLLAGVTSLAVTHSVMWVADSAVASLARVSLLFGGVRRIPMPTSNDDLELAADAARVWVTSAHARALFEVDSASGRIRARIALPGNPIGPVVGAGAVWCMVVEGEGGALVRIDPGTRAVTAQVALPGPPTAAASGHGRLWVAVAARDTVFEIDARTNAIVRTYAVPGSPVALGVDTRWVWVAAAASRRLARLDPVRGAITASVPLRGTPHALALAAGRVFVLGG